MTRLDISPEIEAGHLEQDLRKQFEATTGNARISALFSAIRFCGNQQIPMPEWVVQAFFSATNDWFSARVCGLSEAFQEKTFTPKRLRQLRLRKLAKPQVFSAVKRAKESGAAIDVSLFDRLEKEFGLGKTVLQELYYGPRRRKTLSRQNLKNSGITKK